MIDRMMMARALRGGMGGSGQAPSTAGQLNSPFGSGAFARPWQQPQMMGGNPGQTAQGLFGRPWQQPQMAGGNPGQTAQGLFGQGMATLGQMRPDLNLSGVAPQAAPMMGEQPAQPAQPAQPSNPRAAFFGRLMHGMRDRAQS
jgi:hypothetical protein